MKAQPPVNQLAERQLLGACLRHPGVLDRVVDLLEPSVFYTPAHGIVFSAACRVALDGPVDPVAVVETLRESGELAEIGGEGIVQRCLDEACDPSDAQRTMQVVHELHRKRETISAARKLAMAAANGEDDGPAFEELAQVRAAAVADEGWTALESLITGVLAGTHRRTDPTLLSREDGACLLYPGRLSWIAGPPESMKSWLALLACIQEMSNNRPAAYIDFEEPDGVTISERVVAVAVGLGFDAATVLDWTCGPVTANGDRDQSERLLYYTNARTLTGKLRTRIIQAVRRGVQLVILDGCAAAMGAAELEEDKARDVNLWLAGAVWPIVRAGAAVAVIDHVVKNAAQPGAAAGGFAARGPRGSGAKLAAVSGVTIIADPKEPGSAFAEGRVELVITKDRPGRIKAVRRGARRLAGVLVSTPVTVNGIEATRLRVINPDTDEAEATSKEEREAKWCAIAAERISTVLADADGPLTKTEVRDALAARAAERGTKGLRAETVVAGFELLIDGGWVTSAKDGRADRLTLVRSYREAYGTANIADVPEDPF